jgi:hypothetical protein
MDTAPDPIQQLPKDLYYLVIHALRDALPPPVTDSPEDRIRRDNAIIAQVAALLPTNADEVMLAAQCIAANAQALDCLRLARLHRDDVAHVLKCTAQCASMMRQSRSALTHLHRLQAARKQPAAKPATERPRSYTEAESYALANPSSAALIRSLGRLPKKFNGPPLSPGLVHDLIHGSSPILQALVKKPAHRLAA